MPLTITEALAEIKTIGKRIEKKREAIQTFVARQDGIKDPLLKDGGSAVMIEKELQSIFDLETRIVDLRRGIAHANDSTIVTITSGTDATTMVTMSISEWLTWRREIAPGRQEFLRRLRALITQYRERANKVGSKAVGPGEEATSPNDVVINLNEGDLARWSEALEEVLGTLDGLLSLKNATVIVDV